ncbi:MAG: hypothetical protein ACYCST_10000 [Acidimicrobiales bacterium]
MTNIKQSDAVTVDGDRFDAMLQSLELEETSRLEADDVNEIVQAAISGGVLVAPEGCDLVAYYLDGGDPGFIFGLRPFADGTFASSANVTSFFVEVRDLYSESDDGAALAREVVDIVAGEYTALLPAYYKAFGAPVDVATISYDWMSGLGCDVANAPEVIVGPFGSHGVRYGNDEDNEPYATVGFVLPEGVFAEIEDGTYGNLTGLRIYLNGEE